MATRAALKILGPALRYQCEPRPNDDLRGEIMGGFSTKVAAGWPSNLPEDPRWRFMIAQRAGATVCEFVAPINDLRDYADQHEGSLDGFAL